MLQCCDICRYCVVDVGVTPAHRDPSFLSTDKCCCCSLQPCSVELEEVLLTLRPRSGATAAAAPDAAGDEGAAAGADQHNNLSAADSLDEFAAGAVEI